MEKQRIIVFEQIVLPLYPLHVWSVASPLCLLSPLGYSPGSGLLGIPPTLPRYHMLQEPILRLPHRFGRLWAGTEDQSHFPRHMCGATNILRDIDSCAKKIPPHPALLSA